MSFITWQNYLALDQDDEKDIAKLLIGRRVVAVDGCDMTLDNGLILTVIPNSGCCCGSGEYDIDYLNTVNNAITDVSVDEDRDENDYDRTIYTVYVIANGIKTPLIGVSGTDGNGYYGTGFKIECKVSDMEALGMEVPR